MKKNTYIIITGLLLLVALNSGCTNSFKSEIPPAPDEPAAITEQVPNDDEAGGLIADVDAKKQVVFDFAELSEEDFPRGMWSINQLIDKYGSPESIESTRIVANNDDVRPPSIDVVRIEASFKDVHVGFVAKDTTYFSFYYEVQELANYYYEEDCTLSEADKNVELEIVQLIIYDTATEFPYGIKIGQSMTADIIAAYPEGSANIYSFKEKNGEFYNEISFDYDFRDARGRLPVWQPQSHGFIRYEFDEADVLQSVIIVWRWYSS